jgi:hypothetical protein
MSAFQKNSNAKLQADTNKSENADWREDCVKPAKDTRIQTEVK